MKFAYRGFACFPFLLCLALVASRQDAHSTTAQSNTQATRLQPVRKISSDTKFVSCFNNGKSTGSHLVRTPALVSPDGLRRAYLAVEAIAFQPKDESTYDGPVCENASRLYIAGPKGEKSKLVYSQSPPDVADGNSLKLIDWSPTVDAS